VKFRGNIKISAIFRGATVQWPPLCPDHENFLQATLYGKVRFLPFSSKNCKIQQGLMVFCVSKFQKNWRICGFNRTFRSKKCFSFTRSPWPPLCQILNTPLIKIPWKRANSVPQLEIPRPWKTVSPSPIRCFEHRRCMQYTTQLAAKHSCNPQLHLFESCIKTRNLS